MDLHLIHKNQPDGPQGPLEPVDAATDFWRSGYWKLGRDTVDQCIGGNIFFHDQQSAPSYLGGEITGAEFVDYNGGTRALITFRRLASHEGVVQNEGWYREKSIRTDDRDEWTDEEIDESVKAYLKMMEADNAGEKVNKAEIYRQLEARFGRRNKAYERRMMNISYVLQEMGGVPVRGLQPQGNIGANKKKISQALKAFGFDEQLARIEPPTTYATDLKSLEKKTSEVLQSWVSQNRNVAPPMGLTTPQRKSSESTVYERSPEVKAWVLWASKFICESCDQDAPFKKDDGQQFLEVHHVVPLVEGGPDVVSNAVALCPNCHRAMHYSSDRGTRAERLYQKVNRLVRPKG